MENLLDFGLVNSTIPSGQMVTEKTLRFLGYIKGIISRYHGVKQGREIEPAICNGRDGCGKLVPEKLMIFENGISYCPFCEHRTMFSIPEEFFWFNGNLNINSQYKFGSD